MHAPSLFSGVTLLLPGAVALAQPSSAITPWYLASLAVAAAVGAWQTQRLLPGVTSRPFLALVGAATAAATAHFIAHAENTGGCCATLR